MHGIVAYRSAFLRPNVCEEIRQFLSSIKKMHAKKIGSFFLFHGVVNHLVKRVQRAYRNWTSLLESYTQNVEILFR